MIYVSLFFFTKVMELKVSTSEHDNRNNNLDHSVDVNIV